MDIAGNLRCWKEGVVIAKRLSKIHQFYPAVVIFWKSLQLAKRLVLSREETLELLDCLWGLIQLGDQVRKVNKKEERVRDAVQLSASNSLRIMDYLWRGRVGNVVARYFLITHQYQLAVTFFREYLNLSNYFDPEPIRVAVRKQILYFDLLELHRNMGEFDIAQPYLELFKDDEFSENRRCLLLAEIMLSSRNYERAIQCLERARETRSGQDRRDLFLIYQGLGRAFMALLKYSEAVKSLEECLKIAHYASNKKWEALTCFQLGENFLHGLGELEKAKGYMERHLSLAKELGDREQQCLSYLNLGNYYHATGEFQAAITWHTKQLEIAQEINDKALQRHAHSCLGREYSQVGSTKKSMENLEQSLKIAQEEGGTAEGEAYGNIGNVYKDVGEYVTAINYFEKSRSIASRLCDRVTELNAHFNLGSVYRQLGDYDKAEHHLRVHLKMAEKSGNKAELGKAYHNLGQIYRNNQELEKAIKFLEKAFQTVKETNHKVLLAHVCGSLGAAYLSRGDTDKFLKYNQECLEFSQLSGYKAGEMMAVGVIGTSLLSLGNFTEAAVYNKRCLKMSREAGLKNREAEAHTMLGLGEEIQRDHEGAKNNYLSAIRICEEIQQGLGNRDDYKVHIGEIYSSSYRGLTRVLISNNEHEEALVAAERGRSRTLADLMRSSYRIQASEEVGRKPLGLSEIKASVKRDGVTTIVMSEVNDQSLYLWVVEPNGGIHLRTVSEQIPHNTNEAFFESIIKSFYQKIEKQERGHCEDRSLAVLYEAEKQKPTKANLRPSSEEDLCFEYLRSVRKKIVAEKLTSSLRAPYTSENKDNSQALRRLYSVIIAPVVDFLRVPEILVVPDGSFHMVPLAALKDERGRFLSESHRIRVLPSLKTLMFIQESPPEYHNQSGALIVGDPNVSTLGLPRLRFAKKESEMIRTLLPNATLLIGDQATKEEVLKQMGAVALIHIAAHGDMETGEIALAPNPTCTSQIPKKEDFLLSMADVHRVRLRAKLVVLSSCHSGRGMIKAEGVVGIARAFLGAGARSVLVSLWAVDDESTMMFMRSFYEHLHGGDSASEALHQAMKCLRESQQFSDVKYWAPFVLIGDDVRLEFQ